MIIIIMLSVIMEIMMMMMVVVMRMMTIMTMKLIMMTTKMSTATVTTTMMTLYASTYHNTSWLGTSQSPRILFAQILEQVYLQLRQSINFSNIVPRLILLCRPSWPARNWLQHWC